MATALRYAELIFVIVTGIRIDWQTLDLMDVVISGLGQLVRVGFNGHDFGPIG